jgi:hypothetical protein
VRQLRVIGMLTVVTWIAAPPVGRADAPPIRFGRDILPILSENCFQ